MQQQLIQDQQTQATIDVINRFNVVFNDHDVDGIMALMTDDCLFEGTGPAPDGGRFQGQAGVRKVWEEFFASSPNAMFDEEELVAAGNRCFVRWTYHWVDETGNPGHIRGIDIFTVRDGKVSEKLAYVKG